MAVLLDRTTSGALLCLITLLSLFVSSSTSFASTPYTICLKHYKQQQFQQTLQCICKFRQHSRRSIQLYHLAQTHFQLATKLPALSVEQLLHAEQALLRYQQYSTLRQRLAIIQRKKQKLQDLLNLGQLYITITPPSVGWYLKLRSAHMTCTQTSASPVWQCIPKKPRHKKTQPAVQRCMYQPLQKQLTSQGWLPLPAGPYTLSLQQAGYLPVQRAFVLLPKQRKTLHLQLREQLATLQIQTQPRGALIKLQHKDDSVLLASTPYQFARLKPGRYHLTIQKQGYVLQEATLQMRAGQQHTTFFQLQPIPSVSPVKQRLWISFGVFTGLSVLALAGGIATGVVAHIQTNNVQTIAYQTENWKADFDSANRLLLTSGTLYTTSAVTGATALGLLIAALLPSPGSKLPNPPTANKPSPRSQNRMLNVSGDDR